MTAKKTEELDFSPFNAEDVLTALCKVLRTSKAISFSYAGDIQSLIDRIGRVFHSARALMFVVSTAGGKIEVFEYVAEGVEPVARQFEGMHGQKMAEDLMVLEDDINKFDDTDKFGGQLAGGYFMPLKIRGETTDGVRTAEKRAGLLYLQESPLSRWNKLVMEIFVVIADHLARLAQIEYLSRSLAEFESADKLTGFLQRKSAMEAVQKEIARASFFGDHGSLILIDLDLGTNSTAVYGTTTGEAVLKTVASTISSNSRKMDLLGRFGLDEFLLYCPRLDDAECFKNAESLVKRINENLMNLTHRTDIKIETGVFVPTTASIGVAHWSQVENQEGLFALAQEALNKARMSGGNCARSMQ